MFEMCRCVSTLESSIEAPNFAPEASPSTEVAHLCLHIFLCRNGCHKAGIENPLGMFLDVLDLPWKNHHHYSDKGPILTFTIDSWESNGPGEALQLPEVAAVVKPGL